MSAFTVRPGTIDEALAVEALIPEFGDTTARERYEQQLRDTPALILVAEADEGLVGYKVGYESQPGVFYSWLGGVTPAWRRRGVATGLRMAQEVWARNRGYKSLEVKSRNRFPAMLLMLISAGYHIVEVRGHGEAAKIRFALPLTAP